MHRGPAKDYLRDLIFANELGHRLGHVAALHLNELRTEILGKAHVGVQGTATLLRPAFAGLDVHHVELGVQTMRHARSPGNELLGCGIGADTDRHSLAYAPVLVNALALQVLFQAPIYRMGHVAQRQLPQGEQVAGPEEIGERLFRPLHRVDIAAPHARLQGFGRKVRQHHLIGALQYPVRNRLSHLDTGNGLYRWSNALQVLDVHGGEDVDLGFEDLQHIFVTLLVLAAFDVGMRQLIDKHDLRLERNDGLHVHFFKHGAFVFQLLPGNGLELRNQLGHAFTAVRFSHADHHVFAALAAADGFTQHVVSLADSGGIAQEELEDAGLLLWSCLLQPLFRSLGHGLPP